MAQLPWIAQHFLETCRIRRVRHIVYSFHHWLELHELRLAELTPALLKQFVARPRQARVSRRMRRAHLVWMRYYLRWLHQRGLVSFVPVIGHQPPELPPAAHTFLSSLVPTFSRATVNCYTFSLRKLYAWLTPRGLAPEHLTRPQIERWLRWIHDLELSPSTRHHILVESRAYLRWLAERRRMRTDPDELIRKTDFPKLPRLLPRPLRGEVDLELQRRLAASHAPAAWALLLMRRTGLRIGELRDLAYHCIRADEHRPLLKVPIGKLRTERLVPLDPTSLELVRRLQAAAPRPRDWLVPGHGGARAPYCRLRSTLKVHSYDLHEPTRITCHRLRHTFATEMLGAGMSLVGVMRLLGHRDYHMTLRYAAVTPDLVHDEYTKALVQLADKYQLHPPAPSTEDIPAPDDLLDQLTRWLRKQLPSSQPLRALLKRIERLRNDFQNLDGQKPRP